MKFFQNSKSLNILLIIIFFVMNTYAQESDNIINLKSDWLGSVFGNVGGDDKISEQNFMISENNSGVISLSSKNNRGKISSSSEGIAFVYKEINSNDNFEMSVSVKVNSFQLNNQVSFGLMIRDTVYANANVKQNLGSYIAAGPLDSTRDPYRFGFSRTEKTLTKYGTVLNTPKPMTDALYHIILKKSGNSYSLSFGNEKPFIIENFDSFNSEKLFLGMFTARNTEVEYDNIDMKILENNTERLIVTDNNFKKKYLLGEDIDTSGLKVEQIDSKGKRTELLPSEYFIGGFDSSVAGPRDINIYYNGESSIIPIEINELSITSLELLFPPLKSDYHLFDKFDPLGIQVMGIYNNGYKKEILNREDYRLTIDNIDADGMVFNKSGVQTVQITSIKNPAGSGSFTLNVSNAELRGLEISRTPTLLHYYVGDQLNTNGLVVYALYNDNSKIRLTKDEYDIGEFVTSTAGEKDIIVSFRGATAKIKATVEALDSKNMVVSKYPKTTYDLGESFDKTDLEVSKLFNNGTYQFVESSRYEIDSRVFTLNQTGQFDVKIIPGDTKFSPISLPVTIKNKENFEWKTIAFGQSISEEKNYTLNNNDGSLSVVALEGGGKVTKDHDGLTFYYTEIDPNTQNFELECDIRVNHYAKTPHDGQESFGLLARDSIGINYDASINASNLVAIGGYSGGTRNINGTQLIKRQGITSTDGAGSQGTKAIMLDDTRPSLETTYPQKKYHLKLKKSNSGFHGVLNDGVEAIYSIEDTFDVQDPKLYVGFYAARLASIDIHNMEFTVSQSITDAPPIPVPETPKETLFEILSPLKTSNEEYKLILKTNCAGTLTVKKDFDIVQNDITLDSGQLYEYVTDLNLNSLTNFSVVFVPDETQALTSYETIIHYLSVEQKMYLSGKDIYVSVNGKEEGEGTRNSPLDLDTAIYFVTPGQKIIMADGLYERRTPLLFNKYNDGKENAYKKLEAAPGTRPVLDFKRIGVSGVILSGNYWKVKGIDFTHTAGNTKGFVVGGNYNIIEDCKFYENGDTGLSINRTDVTENNIKNWPSNNLILNCESYDNVDPSQNNADGFAAKITSGYNNVFRGCISHHNIDDGWDLYAKAGSGAIGAVLIDECITYENGTLTNGSVGKGDKNGFKMGGEGILVPHILRNSLSFKNGANGITNNSNPGIVIENSLSVNNYGENVSLQTYRNVEPHFQINNLYTYPDNTAREIIIEKLKEIPGLNIFTEQLFD